MLHNGTWQLRHKWRVQLFFSESLSSTWKTVYKSKKNWNLNPFCFSESTKPKGNSRRRDYPRGGYDVNWLASSGGYGGRGGRRQRDHQRQRGQTSASSQSLSSGSGTNPQTGGAGKPSVMLEDEFEVGSVFNAGSKKQNINHLLNFQFEPRGSQANKKSANNTKQKFFSKSSGKN